VSGLGEEERRKNDEKLEKWTKKIETWNGGCNINISKFGKI
jgi:hypothetical protein